MSQEEPIPAYIFFNGKQGVVGTPTSIEPSDGRTTDLYFNDLCDNQALQRRLGLACFLYGPETQNKRLHIAAYLSSFAKNPQERGKQASYLFDNNGLLRVLLKD